MITRYCGFPNPEYQILTSRSPLRTSVLDKGARPAVTAAASFVSKMTSGAGPVSVAVKEACCARDELLAASRREAANVSRLMPKGLFSASQRHIFQPQDRKSTRLNSSHT